MRAGLNIGLSGIPWWTTDIGGFHGGDPATPVLPRADRALVPVRRLLPALPPARRARSRSSRLGLPAGRTRSGRSATRRTPSSATCSSCASGSSRTSWRRWPRPPKPARRPCGRSSSTSRTTRPATTSKTSSCSGRTSWSRRCWARGRDGAVRCYLPAGRDLVRCLDGRGARRRRHRDRRRAAGAHPRLRPGSEPAGAVPELRGDYASDQAHHHRRRQPRRQLRGVCDLRIPTRRKSWAWPTRASTTARSLPPGMASRPGNVFADWRQVAERPRFADAVIVATPDALHAEPAIALANLGYHILLEKPMAPNAADCRRIVAAAAGQRHRCSPSATCCATRLTPRRSRRSSTPAGSARSSASSTWSRWASGTRRTPSCAATGAARRESSFMLLAKSCHDLDWIRHIMGKRCTQVSSFGSLLHFRPREPAGRRGRPLPGLRGRAGLPLLRAPDLPRPGAPRRHRLAGQRTHAGRDRGTA